MKKISLAIATALFAISCTNNEPQNSTDNYEIATWQGFRTSAASFTFDDNLPAQFTDAVPLLEKYGLHGTFYPVINWVTDWEPIRQAAENGHEIGSHTVSHPNLSTLPEDSVRFELAESKKIIEREIGKECLTIAYPYCAAPADSLTAEYYIAARICDRKHIQAHIPNTMRISSLGVGSESEYIYARDINNYFEEGKAQGAWSVLLIHELDNGNGYSPLTSQALDSTLNFLSQRCEGYWVAPFADVALYALERESAQIYETRADDSITISVTTKTLPRYVPLTVRRPLPEGWSSAATVDGNANLCISGGYINIDITPGNSITITKHK